MCEGTERRARLGCGVGLWGAAAFDVRDYGLLILWPQPRQTAGGQASEQEGGAGAVRGWLLGAAWVCVLQKHMPGSCKGPMPRAPYTSAWLVSWCLLPVCSCNSNSNLVLRLLMGGRSQTALAILNMTQRASAPGEFRIGGFRIPCGPLHARMHNRTHIAFMNGMNSTKGRSHTAIPVPPEQPLWSAC